MSVTINQRHNVIRASVIYRARVNNNKVKQSFGAKCVCPEGSPWERTLLPISMMIPPGKHTLPKNLLVGIVHPSWSN